MNSDGTKMVSVASNLNTNQQHSIWELLRNTALVTSCLFTNIAAFILLARSHLYSENLTGQQVWIIGLTVISGVALLRCLGGFPSNTDRSRFAKYSWYLQSFTIFQIILLLSVTTRSTEPFAAVAMFALISEAFWWIQNYRNGKSTDTIITKDLSLDYDIQADLESRLLRSLEKHHVEHDRQCNDAELPDHASQFWVRTVDIHGETISASQRVQFTTAQRHQHLHLSFVPGLPSIPHVKATLLEGPDVEITVAEKQDFGIRLDLKLNHTYEEPVEVLVQIEIFAEIRQAA
tara:strand:+ start:6075 stop:6944 length:870 start_codon:yes stop_codon:yes gene_type:complete